MAPIVVMLKSWLVFRVAGVAGLHAGDSWIGSLRFAMAVMFTFTGVSHFVPSLRAEMVKMVPPIFPRPSLLVAMTGILEIVGAVGLVSTLYRAAAVALAVMLVAMFPANVRAAKLKLTIAGKPAMEFWPRLHGPDQARGVSTFAVQNTGITGFA